MEDEIMVEIQSKGDAVILERIITERDLLLQVLTDLTVQVDEYLLDPRRQVAMQQLKVTIKQARVLIQQGLNQ